MTPDDGISRRRFLGAAAALLGQGIGAATPMAAGASEPTAVRTVQLPIPARIQWNQNHGYCGECSIQQAALYYGAYVSEYAARALFSPDQRRDVLVGASGKQVLKDLRFTSEEFDFRRTPEPQFEPWFGWVARHLAARHPVMITCFIRGLDDPYYDHIMLATGFTGRPGRYSPRATLTFNDNFSPRAQTRRAATLPDTRQMRGNGARYRFCIPERMDFSLAVTGIMDDSGAALPVHVLLDNDREPNIIAGQSPVDFAANVSISGLVAGKQYVLYRYNDCRDVPTRNYAASRYASAQSFVASGPSALFGASIRSDRMAIFRCLPARM